MVATGACSSTGRVTSPSEVDDSAITWTVRSRLVEDKSVELGGVQVQTVNGAVLLSGAARSTLEKSIAESIAMKIRGVKSIQNNLTVTP